MYQFSYSEVLADDPADARRHERRALEHAIGLLTVAQSMVPGGPEEREALGFVTQLWAAFIHDLAQPGNDLPAETRGALMSLGLFIMGQVQRIESGETRDFAPIVDICAAIRDGLN